MARNREGRTNPRAGLRRGDEGALRLQILTLGQAVLVFSKAPDLTWPDLTWKEPDKGTAGRRLNEASMNFWQKSFSSKPTAAR